MTKISFLPSAHHISSRVRIAPKKNSGASDLSFRSFLICFRYVMAAVLGLAALSIGVSTYHWPLIWDAQVFHYGNFLITHGFAPYRDIVDMNMPGAYLIDAFAIKAFGAGDLAWRIFDFALLGSLCLSMIAIAWPYDWFAGLFAGVMFALVHAAEGPANSGQRDEIMTVLIVAGCAFLFASRRHCKPWMMVPFGFSMGMATSVKPTAAPLGPLLLILALWGSRTNARAPYVWRGLLGASIAAAIVAAFLLHYGSAGALVATSIRLTSYYAELDHLSFQLLLLVCLPLATLLLLPFALAVAPVAKYWNNREQFAILAGVAFGAVSYFLQGKGYAYHRYVLAAFALLWIAIQLTIAIRQGAAWIKIVATTGLAVGMLVLVPLYTRATLQLRPVNLFTPALERDLRRIGPNHLQHKIQCLDLVDGCYNALYHLGIVQASGSMGDLLLFAPDNSPVVDYYRDSFWNALIKNPPSVIVLSNQWFNRTPTFDKLNAWPRFSGYLASNYKLLVSRDFDEEAHHAYRIYVRVGISIPGTDHSK
jgi:hypothetical protein